MKRFLLYLNPIQRLGNTRYSVLFPLVCNISLCVLSEFIAHVVFKNPEIVGTYLIFLNIASVIYFSFRDGIRGGIVTTAITIIYYLYIIQDREYSGQRLTSGLQATFFLALIYLALSGIIGWLKETIDKLINREADERRRLQAVIEQLPVGVVITDSKGSVIQANKRLESMLGVKVPVGYVLGKDKTLVEGKRNNKPVDISQTPLLQALSTGKAVVGWDFEIKRKDGKPLYAQINSSAIRNKHDKIIAAASIVYDTTMQRELEKRKDDFVNMASHELKTPLTSMKLYIDTLISRVKKHDDEKANKILKSIKYQTEKLQELVSDLLDVSRIQTGKLSLYKEAFKIDELIEETIEGLQDTAKTHTLDFIKKSSIIVIGDRFRIYQVLTNLITNAIKYSPDNREIIIRVNKNGKEAIISVQDFGIGLAEEERTKIFERLYQVGDAKEKTYPGLGMGLYIAKEIMKKHKGKIWVESEKNKGSTFYFSLPLKEVIKK